MTDRTEPTAEEKALANALTATMGAHNADLRAPQTLTILAHVIGSTLAWQDDTPAMLDARMQLIMQSIHEAYTVGKAMRRTFDATAKPH